jgi:tetratricopeptide (TPR) repeat protein
MSELHKVLAHAAEQHRIGNLAEAEVAYRTALEIAPRHPMIIHNLGVILAAQRKHHSAISLFDQVIAAQPQYASAHYNRGVAFEALGQTTEAIRGLSRACAVDPGYYEAHRALGFLWLGEGNRSRSLDHFARTYELRRGEDRSGIADRSLNSATRSKLIHDCEQFKFLARRRRDNQRFERLARTYSQVASDIPDEVSNLSEEQLDLLGNDYNTAIHICPAPEITKEVISSGWNREKTTSIFKQASSGVVVIDNLLSPEALSALQRYLLESTIWHDFSHISGFVASYLEDGLACPLLLQIVDELRNALPDVLGPHPLTQAWAFKALRPHGAIDPHADDAVVSVNFWVTRNEANLEPERGGLSICQTPPPNGWQLRDYNVDKAEIVAFLVHNATKVLTVPYGENRAVLFKSRLFHQSDAPHFEKGYVNHRVNVTLLFGRHNGKASIC